MEGRPDLRLSVDLKVRVWGLDAEGKTFSQNAQAENISQEGARISGLNRALAVGDVIGVQYEDRKARFRVVWNLDAGDLNRIESGLQLVAGQECPWKQQLAGTTGSSGTDANRRRFKRHKILFPLEFRNASGGAPMQTSATDVSGRGCYIETMMPFPVNTQLRVTFWMGEEKVETDAVVRAHDPSFGMGIEFLGLTAEVQEKFQSLLDSREKQSTSLPGAKPHGQTN